MGMFGFNGVVLPLELKPFLEPWLSTGGTHLPFGELEAFGGLRQLGWITVLLAIVWLCPNSQTMVQGMQSSRWGARFREERWAWMCLGGLAVWVVMLAAINGSHGSSEFIYFNF